jgi:LytR cell envelope-related transcriptional attenuator
MGSMPFAFSVHNFISSVGADAGFAAIVGLAILVLLYFAHARETANLREEAVILNQRLQQAEARVAELSRAQSAAPAVAPPPAVAVQVADRRRAGVAGVPLAPFAPAGVGAPALAAATRVIPASQIDSQASEIGSPSAGAPEEEREPVYASTAQPAAPAAAQPALAASAAALSASPPGSSLPRPATAAGGNGAGHPPVAAPVGAASTPPRTAASPGAALPPRQLPPLAPATRRSSAGRRVALVVAALAVAAAAVVLVVVTGVGSSSKPTPGAPASNAPAPPKSAAAAFKPSSVTVAVLNATATNQLAHRVAAKLVAVGYREGTVATAANQTATTTVVAYLPGAKNRADALHVATALKLTPGSVRPVDQGTRQVACPPPAACTANVVVTVGSDLATL